MNAEHKSKPRLCLDLSQNGVVAYANRAALAEIRDRLNEIVASDPKEHFECHVIMMLEDDETRFEGKHPPNVWVKASEDVRKDLAVNSDTEQGFELTFMHVEESDLDKLSQESSECN